MESVVMAIEVLYRVRTGVRLDLLTDTCRLVEQITGLANGYFKPVVGVGRILVRCQQRGAAKGRPLRDDEFLALAEDEGAADA